MRIAKPTQSYGVERTTRAASCVMVIAGTDRLIPAADAHATFHRVIHVPGNDVKSIVSSIGCLI